MDPRSRTIDHSICAQCVGPVIFAGLWISTASCRGRHRSSDELNESVVNITDKCSF
jgi:hypothetical protein